MSPWKPVALVVTSLAAVAFLGAGPQDTRKNTRPPRGAKHLVEMNNWVRRVEIKGTDVILTLAMPTPGWKLGVDGVGRPDATDRIKVSITGSGPEGLVPAVITDTKVRVTLGSLPKGRYILDVFGRHDAAKPHRRMGVALLHAFDKWGE